MPDAKILAYDIETTPLRGYAWGRYEQNLLRVTDEFEILSVAWKWVGLGRPRVIGQDDFSELEIVEQIWDLWNEADIIVAHNGDRFDQPKVRARMAFHGLEPPPYVRSVDTLKVAKRHFAFSSNRLDDLCQLLGVGVKGDPGGIDTWLGCMNGDPEAWRVMKKYNKQDVVLLENLYLRLRPWMDSHPNLALITDELEACPKCGSTEGFDRWGWRVYIVTKRQRFRCKSCRGYCNGRTIHKSEITHTV